DDIRPRAVVVKLNELWREGKEPKESKDTEELPVVVASVSAKSTTDARLQVAGVSGLLTKLANCCYPLPGDEVVGFVSRGKGVIVHRADCQNIARFRKQDRERIVAVNWVGMSQPRYLAPILITARDRAGLIRDVAAVITDASINLMSINSHAHKNREQVLITATLEVDNLDQLHRLFMRLEKIKDVIRVERDLGKPK
ncbi:MAG: bifunctional (p)ppGpp synthetase/guanosine-3',5'-bis(diphosphate) 3'-pyrophosphohydrolase, partial [Ktedonobacteraceae bacterium]|nr:bifunctional (p)ppGpp synthetase/guanosine-3',5'-bis(diphosphate) 3'-pyrophosphohydrolase [Ktedonobacteraceae bacterium]